MSVLGPIVGCSIAGIGGYVCGVLSTRCYFRETYYLRNKANELKKRREFYASRCKSEGRQRNENEG